MDLFSKKGVTGKGDNFYCRISRVEKEVVDSDAGVPGTDYEPRNSSVSRTVFSALIGWSIDIFRLKESLSECKSNTLKL